MALKYIQVMAVTTLIPIPTPMDCAAINWEFFQIVGRTTNMQQNGTDYRNMRMPKIKIMLAS